MHADEVLAKYPTIAAFLPGKKKMSNSVYSKLNLARQKFHELKLEKTGHNKFANYKYFELGDFLIPALKVFSEANLCAVVSFSQDLATMRIVDLDEQDTSAAIVITSPMGSAALKGCHEVQNIGAVETYQRRYLWVAALEIVEHDALDATTGKDYKQKEMRHSPTGGAFDLLPADRKAVIVDCADGMKHMYASDDIMGCYEIYCQIEDIEEKTALWDLLKPDSKLRSAVKAYGISLTKTKE